MAAARAVAPCTGTRRSEATIIADGILPLFPHSRTCPTLLFYGPSSSHAPCHAILSPVIESPVANHSTPPGGIRRPAGPPRQTGHAVCFPCMDVLGSWGLEFQRPGHSLSAKKNYWFVETIASTSSTFFQKKKHLIGMAFLPDQTQNRLALEDRAF